MKEEIITNLNNPRQLEKLYRESKAIFKRDFNLVYPDIQESPAAKVWHERLNFEGEEISWGTTNELVFVLVASMVAALIAKIPILFALDQQFFFPRNISFIVFPMLMAYFAWKKQLPARRIAMMSAVILLAVLYINLLPGDINSSDTIILACIHLPLFLWALLGTTFVGDDLTNHTKRLDFLRYNGDLVVMTAIIAIAGGLLTAVTLGLFELIDLKIEKFYVEYIVVSGMAAAPIFGTYLVQTNPQLVNKVSPVIARVFTPLVLVTLIIYLFAIIFSGKDPYNDRQFLIIFNALLIGVMAIIFFSIAEISKSAEHTLGSSLLLALSIVTIVINGIALSAILFRISSWGITPNRLAVLGSNVLMLINLLMIAYRIYKAVRDQHEIEQVERSIASFLPVYALWTVVVVFVFPVLFGFR